LEFAVKKNVAILLTTILVNCFATDKSVLSQTPTKDDKETYNSFFTASLSLIPGGSQIYTKHFTRGFLFLASEGITGWISLNYYKDYHKSFNGIYLLNNELNTLKTQDFSARDTMILATRKKIAEYDNLLKKVRFHNAFGLFAGIGFWNIIDAIGISSGIEGAQHPNPSRAMALSAIPFSGAGQFYNGEQFKAGLVIAAQTSFVFGGIQYHYLMKKSQNYVSNLSRDTTFQEIPKDDRLNAWQSRYNDATKRRTMFFWYSVIFYIYGMTDAYVDAYLSKFEKKFDITADYSPIRNEASFGLTWKF
jgi:TM2 domain-containing membrane protein YozV